MRPSYKRSGGFSLLELVLGIVLLGILMAGSVAMLINLAPKTIDPAMEVQAAQLAQRLLNDISLQKYDQANSHYACGSVDGEVCTDEDDYGPDLNEDTLSQFNDVDDYDTAAICSAGLANCVETNWIPACWFSTDGCGGSASDYSGFLINIVVTQAQFSPEPTSATACVDDGDCAKRIALSVRQPNGSRWHFSVLRGNYQ